MFLTNFNQCLPTKCYLCRATYFVNTPLENFTILRSEVALLLAETCSGGVGTSNTPLKRRAWPFALIRMELFTKKLSNNKLLDTQFLINRYNRDVWYYKLTFSPGNVEIRDYLITPRKFIILFKYHKADSLSEKNLSANKISSRGQGFLYLLRC